MNPNRYISAEEVEHAFNKFKQYLDAVAAKNNIIMYAKTQDKYVSMLNSIYSDCIPQLELLSGKLGKRVGVKRRLSDITDINFGPLIESDTDDLVNPAYKEITKQTMASYFSEINRIDELSCEWPDSLQEAAILFTTWFKYRYGKGRMQTYNPRFFYKVCTIPKWIDVMLIAYGKAFSIKQLDKFVTEFDDWVITLSDATHPQYPVFPTALELGLNKPNNVTPESVVLEHYLKESLYNVNNANDFDKTSILTMYQKMFPGESYSKIEKKSGILPPKNKKKADQ